MPIYILCPSKVSVTFSALSASIIAISSFIPVQNASLIAEIPFNWTVANTRYGIISVVGRFKKRRIREVLILIEWRHVKFEVVRLINADWLCFESVLQKSAEISVRPIFKKCEISFLKHKTYIKWDIKWGNVYKWMKLTIKDRFSAWYYDNLVQTIVSILMSGDGAG